MYSQLRYQTTGRYTRKLDRRCLRPTLTAIVLLRARVPIKRHGIKIRYNVINSGKGAPIYTNVMYSRLLRAGRIYSRYASRKGGFRASTRARFPGISSSAARCLFLRFLSLSLSLSLSFSLSLSLSHSVRYSELLGSFATALFSNATSLRALLVHCLRASVAIASA